MVVDATEAMQWILKQEGSRDDVRGKSRAKIPFALFAMAVGMSSGLLELLVQ